MVERIGPNPSSVEYAAGALQAMAKSIATLMNNDYRAFALAKIGARRDSYEKDSGEWRGLNRLLLDLGAAGSGRNRG